MYPQSFLVTDDDDTETEFARLLNEESEAEVSKENRLKRSNRGAEISDIEDDYIPTATQPEAVIEKVSMGDRQMLVILENCT